MIWKLFAGVAVVAVAVAALLLTTVGTTKAKPAEANVASIGAVVTKVGVNQYALVQVDAQDNTWDFPNSKVDLDITASAGDFVEVDPTFGFPGFGCSDQGGSPDSFRCRVNSNGFGDSNMFATGPGDSSTHFSDILTALGFFTGNTHIQVCNDHDDAGADCDNNTSHVEAWWQAPPGFQGGTVTFCATQTTSKCFNLTVVGPIASLTLTALRNPSEIPNGCQGVPVYVIGDKNYTEANWQTTFDNDRAVMCAVAKDSNGTMAQNGESLVWTTTKGCLDHNVTATTQDVRDFDNRLRACGTAASGDIATVTVSNGAASASTTVQFGSDAASCTATAQETALNVGDTGHFAVVFLDASKNWVPDGIEVNFVSVDSVPGVSALVNTSKDTIKGAASTDIIGAAAGTAVVSATIVANGGAQPACADEIAMSGMIHVVPINCLNADGSPNATGILSGFPPPGGAGLFGTFAFCGGTFSQLFAASKCPGPQSASQSAFFYNKPSGTFAVWIPGSTVAAANAEILALWPEQIPPGTIFTAKCA